MVRISKYLGFIPFSQDANSERRAALTLESRCMDFHHLGSFMQLKMIPETCLRCTCTRYCCVSNVGPWESWKAAVSFSCFGQFCSAPFSSHAKHLPQECPPSTCWAADISDLCVWVLSVLSVLSVLMFKYLKI